MGDSGHQNTKPEVDTMVLHRHAQQSLEYMEKLQDRDILRFCAIPQVMAIATLSVVYNNPKVFKGALLLASWQPTIRPCYGYPSCGRKDWEECMTGLKYGSQLTIQLR